MLVFWIGIISNSQERSKYGTDIYLWFKTIIRWLALNYWTIFDIKF
ncbi:hypothetical protein [Spiroplasma endosymbiont of Villa modesta]